MIHYLIGDATEPIKTPAIIAHICNDLRPGAWGSGFVVALSNKDKRPEMAYREWSHKGSYDGTEYKLGQYILVDFKENVKVANIIGQHSIMRKGEEKPIRYDAVKSALTKIFKEATKSGCSVHMPRIGCERAGGSWNEIEPIILDTQKSVETYVYTLEFQKHLWNDAYENI